jgi:hypothetical protein
MNNTRKAWVGLSALLAGSFGVPLWVGMTPAASGVARP